MRCDRSGRCLAGVAGMWQPVGCIFQTWARWRCCPQAVCCAGDRFFLYCRCCQHLKCIVCLLILICRSVKYAISTRLRRCCTSIAARHGRPVGHLCLVNCGWLVRLAVLICAGSPAICRAYCTSMREQRHFCNTCAQHNHTSLVHCTPTSASMCANRKAASPSETAWHTPTHQHSSYRCTTQRTHCPLKQAGWRLQRRGSE